MTIKQKRESIPFAFESKSHALLPPAVLPSLHSYRSIRHLFHLWKKKQKKGLKEKIDRFVGLFLLHHSLSQHCRY